MDLVTESTTNPLRVRRHFPFVFVLACSVLLLYGKTLSYGFVWDDLWVLSTECSSLRGVLSHLSPGRGGWWFRPLWLFSVWTDVQIWGTNPFGYHLKNVLLHCLNVMLVYSMCLALIRRKLVSFLIALTWNLLPWNAYAVTWLADSETLATSFSLTTIVLYLASGKYNRTRVTHWLCWLGSAGCYCLGLLSKETAVPVVLILWLLDRLALRGGSQFAKAKIRLLPHVLVLAAYSGLRWWVLGTSGFAGAGVLGGDSLLTHVVFLPVQYLRLVATLWFPVYITPDLVHLLFYSIGALIASGPGLLILWRDRMRGAIGFAVAWCLVLCISGAFVPAVRTLYLPSIGFAMFLAIGAYCSTSRFLAATPGDLWNQGRLALGRVLLSRPMIPVWAGGLVVFLVLCVLLSLEVQHVFVPDSPLALCQHIAFIRGEVEQPTPWQRYALDQLQMYEDKVESLDCSTVPATTAVNPDAQRIVQSWGQYLLTQWKSLLPGGDRGAE